MVTAGVRLYLRSPTKLALLTKRVEFAFPPRFDEWVKLRNAEVGNYFAIRIREVIHVEGEDVDVMLESLDLVEEELDEYVASYQAEGWQLQSLKPRAYSPAAKSKPDDGPRDDPDDDPNR